MADDDGMMRASDADRDTVVSVLRDAYAAGRLTLEEFHERTSAAYAGRTWGELRELTSDLPGAPWIGAPGSGPDSVPSQAGVSSEPAKPGDLPPGERRFSGRPARRRPSEALLPFVMVWFLLMLTAHSAGLIALPILAFVLLVVFTSVSRRK